jgi:hypothetical protein
MKSGFHKMTSKAAKARELYAEIYGIAVDQVRKDRPAVHAIYAELEERGFDWVALKQEWAQTQRGGQGGKNIRLTIAVDDSQQADAIYILEEGLKAAGFKIANLAREEVYMSPLVATIIFYMEVAL